MTSKHLFAIILTISNHHTSSIDEIARVLVNSYDVAYMFCRYVLIEHGFDVEENEHVLIYYEPDDRDTSDEEYGNTYVWRIEEIDSYDEYDLELTTLSGDDGLDIESRFWDLTGLSEHDIEELKERPALWAYIADQYRVISDFEVNDINLNDNTVFILHDVEIEKTERDKTGHVEV